MMDSDQRTPLWPMADTAGPESILATLADLDAATGGWSTKANLREKGLTLTLTYGRKASVFVSMQMQNTLEQAPALLADACRRLIAAHEAQQPASSPVEDDGSLPDREEQP